MMINLNPQQGEAVNTSAKATLIIAVPGSGKSTIIVERIKSLLQQGASPYEFLVITFTRKAAQHLKEKLAEVVTENNLHKMFIGTSHSFCCKVLRDFGELIGYKPEFTIYDEVDKKDIIEAIISDLGWKLSVKKVLKAMQDMTTLGADPFAEKVKSIRANYLARLKKYNAYDYDLLLEKAVEVLQNFPRALEHYRQRFKYLLYDEFHDIARLEDEMSLTLNLANSFTVADHNQTIYQFRGSSNEYILKFQERHPDCHVIKLPLNYRSTPQICQAANSLIKHNPQPFGEYNLIPARKSKGAVKTVSVDTEAEESAYIVKTIGKRTKDLNSIAILCRTNAQIWEMKKAFDDAEIPVQVVARDNFWQRREIKNVLAVLRLLVNPDDDFSMGTVLRLASTGYSKKDVLALKHYALENDLSLSKAVATSKGAVVPEAQKGRRALEVFMQYIPDSKYVKWMKEQSLTTKVDDILSIKDKIMDFEDNTLDGDISLEAFLESISLVAAIDSWDETQDAVNIMTVHCAKGLEWRSVFIVGCEEKKFPLPARKDSDEIAHLEEERRLMYVAMTRAKDELICTWAKTRSEWGSEPKPREVSRFLKEAGLEG